MDVDLRLLFFVVWGLGSVLGYGLGLKHRLTRRPRRVNEVRIAIGLFLTAFSALAAITAVLFAPHAVPVRGFFSMLFLGAFFAVGLLMATEKE